MTDSFDRILVRFASFRNDLTDGQAARRYSLRSASSASICAARWVGIQHARSATAPNSSPTPASVGGSVHSTSNRNVVSSRDKTVAATTPAAKSGLEARANPCDGVQPQSRSTR